MSKISNEQPGAKMAVKTQRPEERTPGPPQFETFRARIIANIGEPHWPAEVQQYFIERPQLIPGAFLRGFNTPVVTNIQKAREILEQFLWDFARNPMAKHLSNFDDAMRIIIWITRQSKELNEDVVLHSPFDPDEKGFNCPLTKETGRLLYVLTRHSIGTILWTILKGLGSLLNFSISCSQENVWHYFFTARSHDGSKKVRRLYWKDAVEGSREILPPDIEKIAKG